MKKRYLKLLKNAISLIQNQKYQEAELTLTMLGKKNPEDYRAFFYLGILFVLKKDLPKALNFFLKAHQFERNSSELNYNIGRTFDEMKRYGDAIKFYEQAIINNPNFIEGLCNLGLAHHELNNFDQAINYYDQALHLNNENEEILSNKGLALNELGKFSSALECFNRAIDINPNLIDAYWNKALTLLTIGNFSEGWSLFKYRWKRDDSYPYRYPSIPELSLNDCSNYKNKKILIWHEQGLGDTIQFSRYIQKIEDLGLQVTFQVQKPLLSIFQKNFSFNVVNDIKPEEKFDFQLPLLNTPNLFETSKKNIPSITKVIKADEVKVMQWSGLLKKNVYKLNIGIAISGNPEQKDNLLRSIPLNCLIPLKKYANLYIIQKSLLERDIVDLEKNPDIEFLGPKLFCFDDTAAVIQNMDLIISVCTSLAHLSGAMKKKTFVILRFSADWRWFCNQSDSPWYPTVKIYRQKNIGDWHTVVNNIVDDLTPLIKNKN